MNFTSLQYFLAVSLEKSFSKAAKKLYISQQALNKHIARMEQECGYTFFERGNELKLTVAGLYMEQFAQNVLRNKKQFEMQLTSIQGSQKELLTVAFDGDFCPPSYIAKELDRNRNWELRLTAALPTQAQALLAAGEIDLWLGRTLCDAEQLNVVTMGTYRWAAVVPRWIIIDWFPEIWPETVEFFQNGINLQQFAAAPFLLPDRSSEIRKQIDAYLHYRYKFTPHVILESTQYEILVQRAWMGDGLTICPEPLVKGLFLDEEQKNAHIFPLNDDFWEDKLVIASHKDRPESPSVTSFIQKTRDTLKQTKLIY